jgi:hypothetical protein
MELSIDSADEFENKIFEKLENFLVNRTNEIWNSDRIFTQEVKNELREVSKSKGKIASSNCRDADMGEWLYDFTGYNNREGDGLTLENIFLTAEIEWGKEYDVQYDFEKLVQSRANYRLMIFQAFAKDDIERIIEKLIGIANGFSFSQRDDKYMFAGWLNGENHKFYCHHYIVNK